MPSASAPLTAPRGATERPTSLWLGVPCYLDEVPRSPYADPPDLEIYRARYEYHLARSSFEESLLLRALTPGASVLAVGEGTGEFVASLARKYPQLGFVAFDYSAERCAIATRLLKMLGIRNVEYYVGSAARIPFAPRHFAAVIERGVFHILPEPVKRQNLLEIERVCRGAVVMGWMTNARLYLARRWLQSLVRRQPKLFSDAVATYRMIEPAGNSLRKLARFIERETGHHVRIVYNFAGDQELPGDERARPFLQHLGALTYRTDD